MKWFDWFAGLIIFEPIPNQPLIVSKDLCEILTTELRSFSMDHFMIAAAIYKMKVSPQQLV